MTNKDLPKSKGEFKRMICKIIDLQYEYGFKPYLLEEEIIKDSSSDFYSWINRVKLSITFEKEI